MVSEEMMMDMSAVMLAVDVRFGNPPSTHPDYAGLCAFLDTLSPHPDEYVGNVVRIADYLSNPLIATLTTMRRERAQDTAACPKVEQVSLFGYTT